MKVSVFGSGYVGLVTAACLSDAGNEVLCVDIDSARIAQLNKGEIPIYEPGLNDLIARNILGERLRFTSDAALAIKHGFFQFIAVGTPPHEDGSADLCAVLTVARTLGDHLDGYRIVINKSTVPVGTADKVRIEISNAMIARGVFYEFDVVSNPEFLKEGAAITDFMKPDRVVVGADSSRAIESLRALYAPFTRNRDQFITMDSRSAELTKYAANAMLATKISFINELAGIAEKVGADIEKVRQGIGSDSRIGYSFIYPGAGYGGSCFPKDVRALARMADSIGASTHVLKAVEAVNEAQKRVIFKRINEHFNRELKGRTIALWGLSFKPNTDDIREASSLVLMEALWAAGARVRAYDPVAMDVIRRHYLNYCLDGHGVGTEGLTQPPRLTLCASAALTLEGADALVILTEWQEFRSPDFELLRKQLAHPVIFDGRNLYSPSLMIELGFTYYGMGRGASVVTTKVSPD